MYTVHGEYTGQANVYVLICKKKDPDVRVDVLIRKGIQPR
jgi:hypothetical protein